MKWWYLTRVKHEYSLITNDQILSEGADAVAIQHYIAQMPEDTAEWIRAAYMEWAQLWNKTAAYENQKWEANPWVWVIEFERCERPKEVEE